MYKGGLACSFRKIYEDNTKGVGNLFMLAH